MTKNKPFIFLLLATLLVTGLFSCTPKYDIAEDCKKTALATILGSDSVRSGTLLDGMTMTLVEYRFLPDNKAVRRTTTFGDGVQKDSTSMNLSYKMDEYGEMGVGVAILFAPEDSSVEPFKVKFMNNVLIENDTDTLTDQMAKVDNFDKILSTFPNTTWEYNKTDLYVIDTTVIDTQYVKTRVGPKEFRVDTVITEKQIKDTLGIKQITTSTLSFFRNPATLVNTGHYKFDYVFYQRGDTVPVDSLCVHRDYDLHWNFTSVITARQFNLVTEAMDDSKEKLTFNMFKYTAGKDVIVNSNYTYTFKK